MCVSESVNYLQTTSTIAASFGALAAILSGTCAFLSYQLTTKLTNEMKSDEKIINSKFDHPRLREINHSKCVIWCTLFNKSKRKATIHKINVYDRSNNLLQVTWAKNIDDCGNPQKPCELIGIVDTEELYIRRNDGNEITFCKIEIFDSFFKTANVVTFDEFAEFTSEM